MKTYHCEDCVACDEENNTCKFDNNNLDFDITTKTPCTRFIPEEYIEALNADSLERPIEPKPIELPIIKNLEYMRTMALGRPDIMELPTNDEPVIFTIINKARKRAIKETDETWVIQDKLKFFNMVDKIAFITPTAALKLLQIAEAQPVSFSYTDDFAACFNWADSPQGHNYWSEIYNQLVKTSLQNFKYNV